MWKKGGCDSVMDQEGISLEKIRKILQEKLSKDMSYKTGRTIGSMCTYPHEIGIELFTRYIDKNMGDYNLFPGTREIESEVIESMGRLLHCEGCGGVITTGGTEANLIALWAYREKTGKSKVILPETSHVSLFKAMDILKLRGEVISVNEERKVVTREVIKSIDDDTCCIVAIAGTTELGIIDPIAEISEIAMEKGIFLHVDAAFGGFVIPFLRELGYRVPDFDFSLKGVSSITVDPHKMGLSPIPAGGILFRDPNIPEKIRYRVEYLAGGETEQMTLVGTRSGGAVIGVWGVMKALGRNGYRKIVKRCMENTLYLKKRLEEMEGVEIVTEPTMNILGIRVKEPASVVKRMRMKGWAIARFTTHLRIVITPAVKREIIDSFLKDLKEVVNASR